MSQISKMLDDKVYKMAKEGLNRLGKSGIVARKLQAVISAKTYGITQVSKILGVTRTTLSSWIKSIKNGSVDDLVPKPKKPRPSLLNSQQQAVVLSWLKINPNITIRELRIKIESEFKTVISKSTVHRMIQRLGLAYITPRPKHYKQDKKSQEQFKKKSSRGD